jgi:phytanoyl-CoA hydroxylase
MQFMTEASRRELFEREGYLIVRNLLPAARLAALREAAEALIAGLDLPATASVFRTDDDDRGRDRYFLESAEKVCGFLEAGAVADDGTLRLPPHQALNKVGHALHDLNPEFARFCRSPELVALLDELGFAGALLWQTMLICKPPHIGGPVCWHQDASYLLLDRGRLIGLWIAIDDADRENGCLWLQPGGHRTPLRERYRVDHRSGSGHVERLDGTPWPDQNDSVAAEVSAGSVVLFDSYMPHSSAPNRSGRARLAFTMHLSTADALWSTDNWLQRRRLPPFRLGKPA